MLKKFLAGAATALLALGLVSLVAAPAQAHTGDLNITAVCNSSTGNYDLTAKLTISNTGENGSTMWKVGNSTWTGVPTSNSGLDRGPVTSHGAGTITLGTFSLPGNTTGLGPWVYAYTTWTPDNYAVGSDGQLYQNQALDGTCGDNTTTKKVTICHYNGGSKVYSNPTVSVSSIITGPNGHAFHDNDIIPPFDYIQGGVTKSFPGKNWDAGGQVIYNNGCEVVNVKDLNPPSFGDATCSAYHQVGDGTVTIPAAKTGTAYRYTTDGGSSWNSVGAGTYSVAVGLTVKVEAYALPGYQLDKHATTSWSDTIAAIPTASHCVVTATPTANDSVCTSTPGGSTQAQYTIPSTTGVVYYVNGNKANAGTVVVTTFPQSITVTAQAASGYAFPPGTTTSWPTFQFNGPGDCRVLATASADSTPSVCTGPGQSSDPTFTLGSDTNVTYVVKINNVVSTDNVPGQTYTVGKNDTVTIDATPNAGYKLAPDAPFHQVFSFTDAGACLTGVPVTTAPTSTPTACITDVAGGITPATYTLYPADHISYEVSTDNVKWASQDVGTYTMTPGEHIWIQAIPDQGYSITGASSWDFTSGDLGTQCDHTATPVIPNWVDAVCHENKPGHTQASYTLVAVDGVSYQVSTDGGKTWTDGTPGVRVKVAPGTEVQVKPIADPGYQLSDSSVMTHTFTDPGACEQTVDFTQPSATDVTCTDGETTAGSYTLADVAHVKYNVRVNGHLTKNVAPGTYTANAGDHVVVVAKAAKGWNFGDSGNKVTWTYDFSDGLCTAIPADPTITDQVCTAGDNERGVYTDGAIDIPDTTGVQYTIDGVNAAPGMHSVAPGDHTVVAMALANYKLADHDGPWTWTLTSQPALPCGLTTLATVTPQVTLPSGCTATGTFTLGNDLGIADAVIWTIDGVTATPGSHTIAAGATVHVHAAANAPEYGLNQDPVTHQFVQTDWTVTFTDSATCGQLKTLALTGGPLPAGLIGAGGLLLIAGLSLFGVHLLRRRRGEI